MQHAALAPHVITAFNTASASENRIHDDDTARRFGFTGALVPGVEVYAYMCHMPVAAWGRAFLEEGALECRFSKPVYDGARTVVSATGDTTSLQLRIEGDGEERAVGTARARHNEVRPGIEDYETAMPQKTRQPAGFDTLPEGGALGIEPQTIDRALRDTYLADVRENDGIYERENLIHPGQILRLCNAALLQNVILGPWIHVGSKVRNFAPAFVGDRLTLRSRIFSNVETKGHSIVTFDAIAVANADTVVARIEHVAIWRPRQVAQATS